MAKPFLKWVGGKRWLAEHIVERLGITSNFGGTYYEPMLGGGAVFFAAQSRCPQIRACLSDADKALVNAWEEILSSSHKICALLLDEDLYDVGVEDYLRIRSGFGGPLGRSAWDPSGLRRFGDWTRAAADFIYLNRAGFNGLWRVNRSGVPNMPPGRDIDKAPWRSTELHITILDAHYALETCSAEILCKDFRDNSAWSGKPGRGDAVYLDPPYPGEEEGPEAFTGYTADGFSSFDFAQVIEYARELANTGCRVALSGPAYARGVLERAGFEVEIHSRRGTVSSKVNARRPVGEVLAVAGGGR